MMDMYHLKWGIRWQQHKLLCNIIALLSKFISKQERLIRWLLSKSWMPHIAKGEPRPNG